MPRDDTRTRVLAVAVAFLLVATAVGPAVVASRPAYEIPVHEVDDGQQFENPTSDAWLDTESVEVSMAGAPSGAPNAKDVTVTTTHVRVVRTDAKLYVRMRWKDPTMNRTADDPGEFPDKAAIELPVNESARPPISMGSRSNPVNVWVWSASDGAEELVAGGPGTTTYMANTSIETNATYADGHWQVVFERTLTATGANRTDITLEHDLNVAFAVWDGGNGERGGHKAVSEWYYLPFEADGGPPYETILWLIASAAVLVVTVVTVEGVRRTRGGNGGDTK
ncbi:ethylbenzene dehydrogenase-related protein [Halarchaeum sp. P4]|uniref:ethylbenzene dehydrogenase-related protein n=1 Tax=Halarchaeum sp. P4 TaxID=3421639 RepID=UPI003EB872C0